MPQVLLVRHATSVPPTIGGPDDYNRPLSDVGLRQAEALVEMLVARSPGRVLSSPYLRSVQTVAPTAEALGVRVETMVALREWESGIGVTPEWERHYRQAWARPDRGTCHGESHVALQRRPVSALRELAADPTGTADVAVGSHGTWIARALHGLGCTMDADFWLNIPMPAVFLIEIDGERLHASNQSLVG